MWLFGGSLWFESYKSRHDELHHGIGLCYILAISTTVRRRGERESKRKDKEEEGEEWESRERGGGKKQLLSCHTDYSFYCFTLPIIR